MVSTNIDLLAAAFSSSSVAQSSKTTQGKTWWVMKFPVKSVNPKTVQNLYHENTKSGKQEEFILVALFPPTSASRNVLTGRLLLPLLEAS